jgi:hypothetical protein
MSDNVRKGAALNVVGLINRGLIQAKQKAA